MEEARRVHNGETEKLILTAMIVSDEACARILPMVESEDFGIEYARPLVRMIKRYYRDYGKAPHGHIGDLFLQKRSSLPEATSELLSSLLVDISKRYVDMTDEESENKINPDYIQATVSGYIAKVVQRDTLLRSLELREKGQDEKADQLLSAMLERMTKLSGPSATAKSSFELESITEIQEAPMEDKMWLLDKILPQGGLGLLVAKPKVGKSTFALNMSLCIARGEPFLGFQTSQGPVIYLALEESLDQVKDKMKDWQIKGEPIYMHFGMAPVENLQRQLEKLIEKYQPGLVVIDPLQKFLRVKNGNDYAEVTNSMEPYNAIARVTKCHILFTHHSGKIEGAAKEYIGSTAHLGGVDTMIILRKKEIEEGVLVRTFKTEQRYGKPIEEELVIGMDERNILCLGKPIRERMLESRWIQIKQQLFDKSKLTEDIIKLRTGLQINEVVQTLKWAFDQGLVKRVGSGVKGSPYIFFL